MTHVSATDDVWAIEVVLMVMSQLLWWVGLPLTQTISYFCTMNMWYWMCIAPDHDTWESAFENKKKGMKKGMKSEEQEDRGEGGEGDYGDYGHGCGVMDWGEMQVRESGSFAVNMPWVCAMFGGINYQIEHHLFPQISHVHYPQISPIVQKTCDDFNIPYNKHGTWTSAIRSVIRSYRQCGMQKEA